MTVQQLVELLSKQDPDKQVIVVIDWAKDTAMSDDGGDLKISDFGTSIAIRGHLSNCRTTLDVD